MEIRMDAASMERMDWNSLGSYAPNYDDYSFAKMKADSFNRKPGDLTGYDCPECLNRGRIWIVREDGSFFIRECTCMELRRCRTRMEQSGLGDALERLTFDSFCAREDWQKRMLSAAKGYAENPNGWLFFSGQPGCGKTHLCTAVCNALLLKGKRVLYLPWQQEMASLRFLDPGSREEKLDGFKKAPVLYIDDFLKTSAQRPSDWELNTACALLNARYMSRQPTIVSCEYSLEKLLSIDQAMASRIAEMAGENVLHIREDIRRNHRLSQVV